MSLQCPNSPIYHTSAQQKRQSQKAAKIYRFGTPKLRDLLREKCRIRVRESRQCSYEKARPVTENLSEILRQEVAELEHDIALQEEIYKELLDDLDEWFLEQQEQEASYLIGVSENDDLVCPVCQHSVLQQVALADKLLYKCECDANFCYNGEREHLRDALREKIDQHERQCMHGLNFFVEPQSGGGNILSALCEKCDYFCNF